MPVSVVIGGQYGSEGKGKVSHWLAAYTGATAAVRVGGANSGHTFAAEDDRVYAFRHLPTPALIASVTSYIPAGAYVDVATLLREVADAKICPEWLLIDPLASVITTDNVESERKRGLREKIGSTLSGTGDAVVARVRRDGSALLARDVPELQPYLGDVTCALRARLSRGERVIVEGTQGFGLSLLHSEDYPYATSRDTSAAAFISEAGLSPLDVDDIVLVIRAFPIRVAGNSGPLPNEIDWREIAEPLGRSASEVAEHTTVTNKVRRVARFDPEVVRAAIASNTPTRIVLNHLDYVAPLDGMFFTKALDFVHGIETAIGSAVGYVGVDRYHVRERSFLTKADRSVIR